MNCPQRYLAGGGRVLRCAVGALPDHHVSVEGGEIVTVHGNHVLSWVDADPCAWDADLEGDEVPLELVAIGSLVQTADGAPYVVTWLSHDTVALVASGPATSPHTLLLERRCLADQPWQVVRPVPPPVQGRRP